jgi:hypothetical protein
VILYLVLGCLLLGLVLGGAGMRAHLRKAGAAWRPGAGVLAIVAFVLAAVMGLRESVPGVVVFFALGVWLAVSARRRGSPRKPAASAGARMSRADAASILGVPEDAPKEEVQAAYLRLMRRAHPDSGGTTGLATQLNAARETLLKGR